MTQKLIDLIDDTIEYMERELRSDFDRYTDNVIYRGTYDQWRKDWCTETIELIDGLREEQRKLEDALE